MYFCYVDEAGCTGNIPHYTSDVQPIFALCGLIIPETAIFDITQEFLALKRTFNPSYANSLSHDLDIVKFEIKGAEDLRKPIRKTNRNNARRSIGFLDKLLLILDAYNCKIIPNIYIKSPEHLVNSVSLYARSIQEINKHFQQYLAEHSGRGITIADSRSYDLNIKVSHSIFTQKFKASGDAYPNIIEMPVYGHSDNHVAIQITDILCSALLFPIASHVYCSGYIQSVHVHPKYEKLKIRYADRLKDLSYRYRDGYRYKGGITVVDKLHGRASNEFFSSDNSDVI